MFKYDVVVNPLGENNQCSETQLKEFLRKIIARILEETGKYLAIPR